jgi:hypothetical protein
MLYVVFFFFFLLNFFLFFFFSLSITTQQLLNTLTIQQDTEVEKGQTLTKMALKFEKLQIWKLKQGFKFGKIEAKIQI